MTTLVEYPGRDLPPIIQRAITRANDPSVLQDLSPACRWALSILLRRVSSTDGEDIFWVKRENFAKLIGASEATVYRVLATLERRGLIQRIGQKRSAEGAFTVGELRLSDALCRLLGLNGPACEDSSTLYTYRKNFRLSTMQDRVNNNQEKDKQFSLKKHSENEPRQISKTINKLPADLHSLVKQGLSQPQIFKLMGLATRTGKRLSDIVEVSQEFLKKLQGNALFAYLRTLIGLNKDFAYMRNAQQAEREQCARKQCENDEIARLKSHFAGKWLKDQKGTLFEVYDSGHVAVHKPDGKGSNILLGVLAGEPAREFWLKVAKSVSANAGSFDDIKEVERKTQVSCHRLQ